jgi:ribonuclease VapC
MVIDTSAVVAILLNEPDAAGFELAMERDPVRLIGAATLVELGIVIEARLGEAGARELDLLVHAAAIDVVPFTAAQAELARRAWRRFGKGRHPAGLNLGDCFAYALAATSGEPLLCKGDDFPATDVRTVQPSPADR